MRDTFFNDWHILLFVFKQLISNRVIVKSSDFLSDFLNPQASVPYNKIRRHLVATGCSTTSPEAILPILPTNAFKLLGNACQRPMV